MLYYASRKFHTKIKNSEENKNLILPDYNIFQYMRKGE